MSQRNLVVARRVTRWYVNGRGYNSELAAYMQIAKRWVNETCWEDLRAKLPGPRRFDERVAAEKVWWKERYPAREGCNCSFCSGRNYVTGVRDARGRGCWLARMEDYRKIAREIMSGERDMSGRPILALPEFVEQATGRPLRPYQKEVIKNLKERNEP